MKEGEKKEEGEGKIVLNGDRGGGRGITHLFPFIKGKTSCGASVQMD